MSRPPSDRALYPKDSISIHGPRFTATSPNSQGQDEKVFNGDDNVAVPDALRFRQSPIPSQRGPESRVSGALPPPSPQRIATLSPPIGQFVINMILQIAAFAAAIAFGVFAVKSVTVGNDANRFAARALDEAVIANKLAMLAVCLATGNQTDNTGKICSSIIAGAASVLPSAASTVFTSLPSPSSSSSLPPTTTTEPPTTTSVTGGATPTNSSGSPPGGRPDVGVITGAAVGGSVAALLLIICVIRMCRSRLYSRRSSRYRYETHESFSASPPGWHSIENPNGPMPDSMPPHTLSGYAPAAAAAAAAAASEVAAAASSNLSGIGVSMSVRVSDPDDDKSEEAQVRRRVGIKQRLRELFMDSYVVSR